MVDFGKRNFVWAPHDLKNVLESLIKDKRVSKQRWMFFTFNFLMKIIPLMAKGMSKVAMGMGLIVELFRIS